jgi:glutathione S-transferase
MFKLWGRKDGSNVIKVTWCLGEIGVDYERIDWGGDFGGNDDPEYRAKNPNGRLPTLEEENGFTLWESGAVTRYLCAKFSMGDLYPEDLQARAAADKWMDWSSINFAEFNSIYLDQYFRVSDEERSAETINAAVTQTLPMLDILDKHLADNDYLGGDKLTMADFAAGSLIDRWIHWTPNRPSHANVEAYYERLAARPAYKEHVIVANAGRTAKIKNELMPNL